MIRIIKHGHKTGTEKLIDCRALPAGIRSRKNGSRTIRDASTSLGSNVGTHGITVIGATITPYTGSNYYHPGPASEADRQTINQWIRAAGHFDAVIDFDKVLRDPQQPSHLLPAYDSGDHLHPSPAGYRAMGEAIPLSLFTH